MLDSFDRLAAEADLVLVEGAGSASEINLRAGDIANMGFAQAADVPVVLVGDIDRGGVIASLVGTKAVLAPEDAARIKGFVVNRFRGDPALFASGMTAIAERTGWAPLGLVPHFPDAHRLPAEDALGIGRAHGGAATGQSGRVRIAVFAYPQMSNFDDFDPLAQEPGVELLFLKDGAPLPGDVDLAILPGSKTTIADLRRFRAMGLGRRPCRARAARRPGARHLRRLPDAGCPRGGPGWHRGRRAQHCRARTAAGDTTLTGGKTAAAGVGPACGGGRAVQGLRNAHRPHHPLLPLKARAGKAVRCCGWRMAPRMAVSAPMAGSRAATCTGCSAHDAQRAHWLHSLGAASTDFAYEARIDATLDALAAHLGAAHGRGHPAEASERAMSDVPDIVFVTGDIAVRAALEPGPTTQLLLDILPFQGTARFWGKLTRVDVPLEAYAEPGARITAEIGDLLWSPDFEDLMIPFGPTPISKGPEIRLASLSTRVGRMLDDPRAFAAMQDGAMMTILFAEPQADDGKPHRKRRGLADPRRGKGRWMG